MSYNHYFEEVWRLATQATGTTQPVDPIPDPGDLPAAPAGTLYRVADNFNPATFYTGEAEKFYLAFKTLDNQLEAGNGSYASPSVELENMFALERYHPGKLDLLSLRTPKRYFNMALACLRLAPDPFYVGIAFRFTKLIMDNLETEWETYKEAKLPGEWELNTSGVKKVVDPWSDDTGGTFQDTGSPKCGWRRARAWRTYTNDTNTGAFNNDRRSPAYRSSKATSERPTLKKLLYLNYNCQGGSLPNWGTHLHELDNLLGHGWLFWAGYVLDVNRHLDPTYATYADKCKDYCFNHWGVLSESEYGRTTQGVFKFKSSLHHNTAAHKSIYDARKAWKALDALRAGVTLDPNDLDVKASKAMTGFIMQSIATHPLPANIPNYVENSQNYSFSLYSHDNEFYAAHVGSQQKINIADMSYDTEHGSELINFVLRGETDAAGNVFSSSILANISNTFGAIVERNNTQPGTTPTSTFDPNVGETLSATNNSAIKVAKLFTGTNTGTTTYGGGGLNVTLIRRTSTGTLTGIQGFPSHALLGGFYHMYDPTPNRINTVRWLRRVRYGQSSGQNVTVDAMLANPTGSSSKVWQAVGTFLLHSLIAPSKPLATLSSQTGPYNKL